MGLQVVGRHILHRPIPWTEEIARLLLAWLMCVGGIAALRHAQHPRVTALVRLLSEPRRQAVDRGLRLVLLALFVSLIVPAWQLTVASAGERLPASDISGAWISVILPVALLLMSAVVVQQLWHDGLGPWRDRTSLAWSLGTAERGDRVGADPAGCRRGAAAGPGHRVSGDRRAGPAPGVHACADVAHVPARHRRRRPDHPARSRSSAASTRSSSWRSRCSSWLAR